MTGGAEVSNDLGDVLAVAGVVPGARGELVPQVVVRPAGVVRSILKVFASPIER